LNKQRAAPWWHRATKRKSTKRLGGTPSNSKNKSSHTDEAATIVTIATANHQPKINGLVGFIGR